MELSPNKHTFEMQTCKILRTTDENYRIKTFEIDARPHAKPGQYIMVWIPRVGERPMSLGGTDPILLSVANVGKFSSEIHKLKAGDIISFRGPLGNPFKLPRTQDTKHRTILLVGGGYGVVPMHFLAKEAKETGIAPVIVIGGRKAGDIIYEKSFAELGVEILVTTDDGSKGMKGNALDGVKYLVEKGKTFSEVYSCGPEMMMYYLALYCKEMNIPCQVSVERYMKCGINICGACAIDGKLCCRDGPVFSGEQALKFKDFGKASRDASGKLSGSH